MINQMLNALQNKSAYVSELNKNEFVIEFKTNMNSKIIATIQKGFKMNQQPITATLHKINTQEHNHG